jgi:hypothetical protein
MQECLNEVKWESRIYEGRAVKVCAKAGIGRKVGHKKRVFLHIFKQIVSKSANS